MFPHTYSAITFISARYYRYNPLRKLNLHVFKIPNGLLVLKGESYT